VALGFGALAKDKSDPPQDQLVRIPSREQLYKQDFRIDHFDYNIHGETEEEILGPAFNETYFPSDADRIQTMRGIFQRVIDDRNSSQTAYDIAFG